MPKPAQRPYAQVTTTALQLLGQLIREARIKNAYTTTELAERAGISRSLLQRIERGDPSCAIGAYFEAAVICGVPLFTPDQRHLRQLLAHQSEKLTLLPKSVRSPTLAFDDDF